MLRTLAYTALCSAALIGSSAYGADNTVPANPPAQTKASSGVNFVTAQEKDAVARAEIGWSGGVRSR